MTKTTAFQSNLDAAREQRSLTALKTKLEALQIQSAQAPYLSNSLTNDMATTRLAIELAEPRVATALAVQQQADDELDSTDNYAAEALAEFIDDFKHELGVSNHAVVVRKRPGKQIPETLPEVCISQQEASLDHGGIFAVDRVVATIYAASAEELPSFDTALLLGLLNRTPEVAATIKANHSRSAISLSKFESSGIGNTAPIERLDGGVRRMWVVGNFRGNLKTPRILTPLTPDRAQSLGNNIAEKAKTVAPNIDLLAVAVADSGKVVESGASRVLEVDIELGLKVPTVGWNGEKLGRLIPSACPLPGEAVSGIGRVTKAEVVKVTRLTSTSGYFTVRVEAEALVSE